MAGLMLMALLAQAAPRPAPALRELSPLLGAWQCSGTQRLSPGEKPAPTAGLWWLTRELDGAWISVRQEQERTSENPHPAKANGHLGYSAEQQRFILWLATNDGLSEQEGSNGFEGRRLVFAGQHRDGGEPVSFRRTFELRGDALKITLELELAAKEWTQVAAESCSR